MIRVTVIIPVYNDTERLAQCLDAISNQTLPTEVIEVLVVDNGSDEPPDEVVERYAFVRLLHESQPGSYAARNRALRHATAPIVAFTDADCLPEREWLEAGVEATLSAKGKVVVSGPITIFPEKEHAPTCSELYDIAFGLYQPDNLAMGFFPTANLLVRREALEEVGYFNTMLLSGSDAEWCHTATSCGYDLQFVEQVAIRHPARESLADLIRQTRRFVGGRLDRNVRHNPLSAHYWRVVWRTVVPNVPKMFRARKRLAAKGYGNRLWLKTIPVILSLQYSRLHEILRKRFGGSSERR